MSSRQVLGIVSTAVSAALAIMFSLSVIALASPESEDEAILKRVLLPLGSSPSAANTTDSPAPSDTANGAQSGGRAIASTPGAAALKPGTLLKGGITFLVPRGTPIKLKLSTVPHHPEGLSLLDRDLDGKLYPAQVDQEVTCKTTEDLYVDENRVIPEGTTFHGKVLKIYPARRVGRPGSLSIEFDRFILPNGKTFAFRAEADNWKESTFKSKMKGFGIIAAHAAGGAVVGAMVAYDMTGMSETISMHGYNIAAGAAAGALGGIAVALLRRGEAAVLEPGDDMNMDINVDLLLPGAGEPTPPKPDTNLKGLEFQVLNTKVVRDGLGGHELRVEALISNNSDVRLRSIDLFLEDDNGQRFPVCAGTEDESEILFHVEPHSVKRVLMHFAMEYPKLKRKIVWIDVESQEQIFEQKLP